jgi:hypothetical protein
MGKAAPKWGGFFLLCVYYGKKRSIDMSFTATAFAEQPFAYDGGIFTVDTFPVYPFNSNVLTFTMNLNTLNEFSFQVNTEQFHNLNINTLVEGNLFR